MLHWYEYNCDRVKFAMRFIQEEMASGPECKVSKRLVLQEYRRWMRENAWEKGSGFGIRTLTAMLRIDARALPPSARLYRGATVVGWEGVGLKSKPDTVKGEILPWVYQRRRPNIVHLTPST